MTAIGEVFDNKESLYFSKNGDSKLKALILTLSMLLLSCSSGSNSDTVSLDFPIDEEATEVSIAQAFSITFLEEMDINTVTESSFFWLKISVLKTWLPES